MSVYCQVMNCCLQSVKEELLLTASVEELDLKRKCKRTVKGQHAPYEWEYLYCRIGILCNSVTLFGAILVNSVTLGHFVLRHAI